tara:strand:+ start:517 stop:882 length:366 start_codon:yes stop_codon:yes gene_type:complete
MKKNKKGPLSKVEKTQINDMLSHGDNIATISDATRRSEGVIQKYLNSNAAPETVEQSTANIKVETPKGQASTMFARNKEAGVVTMTEAASAQADATRTERVANRHQSPPRYHRHIHKIKED